MGLIAFPAVVVLIVIAAAASANGSETSCQQDGGTTVAESRFARVYYGASADSPGDSMTYACLYSRGRRVELGLRFSGDPGRGGDQGRGGQRNVRLAGRYVAFEGFLEGKNVDQHQVVVIDLRTGRRRHDTPTTARRTANESGVGSTTGIVLRASGDVAWIARDGFSADDRLEVWKRERRRSPLAQGTDIDPDSLRLAGRGISWEQAGTRRTATLGT